VREVGELTFALARQVVDEVVRVTNDEICAAIKDIFDDTRSVMEPAGALAVAGLKAWAARSTTSRGCARGGAERRQHELRRLRFVAERAELGEAREALLRGDHPERPGAFREFCAMLGRRVVTEFNYRLGGATPRTSSSASPPRRATMPRRWPARLTAAGYETAMTSRTTRWPSCTCATWSAAARATRGTSARAASSSPSAPAR
jgi:hypothetical protein